MSEGTEDILSIIQPETPSAGGETGAGGAEAKGGSPTPEKEDGGDASGREGRSGQSGPAGEGAPSGGSVEPENEDGETGRDAGAGEEAEAEDGDRPASPRKGGVEKRIGELTHRNREAEREAAYLRGQNDALQKLLERGRGSGSAMPGTPPGQPVAPDQPVPVQSAQVQPAPDPAPRLEDFQGRLDDYLAARTNWAVRREIAGREAQAARESQARAHAQARERQIAERQQRREAFFKAGEVVQGFTEAFTNSVHVTESMADALYKAPEGPMVGLYLAKKPEEARRISALRDPIDQALEIGALSARIAAAKAARKTTTAPPPIDPLSSGTTAEVVDPANGPKDIGRWMKWEREKRMKGK
jgi:hypothetical protein